MNRLLLVASAILLCACSAKQEVYVVPEGSQSSMAGLEKITSPPSLPQKSFWEKLDDAITEAAMTPCDRKYGDPESEGAEIFEFDRKMCEIRQRRLKSEREFAREEQRRRLQNFGRDWLWD